MRCLLPVYSWWFSEKNYKADSTSHSNMQMRDLKWNVSLEFFWWLAAINWHKWTFQLSKCSICPVTPFRADQHVVDMQMRRLNVRVLFLDMPPDNQMEFKDKRIATVNYNESCFGHPISVTLQVNWTDRSIQTQLIGTWLICKWGKSIEESLFFDIITGIKWNSCKKKYKTHLTFNRWFPLKRVKRTFKCGSVFELRTSFELIRRPHANAASKWSLFSLVWSPYDDGTDRENSS